MESRCIGRNAAHNTQPHRETAWTSGLEGRHALYARRNDRQPRCALRCGRTARIVGGSKSMLVITDPRTYLSVCLGAVHVVQHLPGPQPLKRLLHCHHTLVLQQHNMGCGRVGCDMRGMYTLSQKCDTVLQQWANPAIQTTGQAQTPLEEALLLPDLHTPTWMRACIFRAAEHVGVRPGGQLHPPITLPLASHHPPIILPSPAHHPPKRPSHASRPLPVCPEEEQRRARLSLTPLSPASAQWRGAPHQRFAKWGTPCRKSGRYMQGNMSSSR